MDATRPALALLTAAALALTGCTPTPLPTYDTVRGEAQAAMQRVVDELPAGLRVDKNPSDKPFGCSGDGVFYTGQWTIETPEGFDGQAFVDELPEALGEDFRVEETRLELSYPAVSFIGTGYANSTVDVSVLTREERVVVDLLSTSRCAQPPATEAP
ncbi:hypothetical protein [Microbacterium sp. RURRCA19A]|uniref:hypothetical protein n=1 Tax=Microbacterium sp. RURRCA19A TaxID=1907391 RepID=UPI0009554EFE|nr:hypothetical protein [Microbacterium sp. RURRCA19A]SIR95071.1 hypothetical protein SAMN05880568_1984 [Microbacterium sp. RURRCA19A]